MGCPVPGDFQGEAGSGPGQPDLVPGYSKRLGLDGLQESLATVRIL